MPTLVSVEPYSGTLRRYEQFDIRAVRLTHMATAHGPKSFSAAVVEDFRTRPDPRFAVSEDSGEPDPPRPAMRAFIDGIFAK